MRGRRHLWLALLACAGASTAQAREEPLWEAGLGIGALSFADYRGSDERQLYPVPVPYFVYRGDFFKSDRDGMRGRLFDKELAELDISVGATIPVRSENNAARSGMPDLDPTIELGPSLEVHLWRSKQRDRKLDLVMPLRVPVTIESSPRAIGWVFSPRLNIDIENFGAPGWDFGAGIGPVFAAERFHEYFYGVAPEYATPTRPAYDAHGGYSGMQVLTALSKRFPKYWVGAYLRYDWLGGARFEDSPLVRQKSYLAGGFGIAWMIGESRRTVEADD